MKYRSRRVLCVAAPANLVDYKVSSNEYSVNPSSFYLLAAPSRA